MRRRAPAFSNWARLRTSSSRASRVLAAQEMDEDARLASADDAVVHAEALEDLEGDRLVLLEEVHVVVDDADEAEVVVRLGDRQFLAQLLGQRGVARCRPRGSSGNRWPSRRCPPAPRAR